MTAASYNWKERYIRHLKASILYFGTEAKFDRECWVVKRLLHALGIKFDETDLINAESSGSANADDVSFRDAAFQVKEILDPERRRTDEIRSRLKLVEDATSTEDLLEQYEPQNISFSEVVKECQVRANKLALRHKYGIREQQKIDLVYYFNWIDHSITVATAWSAEPTAFRSLSVVTNRYCAVTHAQPSAPVFLRVNAGKIFQYADVE